MVRFNPVRRLWRKQHGVEHLGEQSFALYLWQASKIHVIMSARVIPKESDRKVCMDISFKVENQKFNYRVCAMILSENKILAMHDERSPYFYLPGGRVMMGETAE